MKIYCDTERYIEEVIRRGSYRFLFKLGTVIDIGANIGTFSFWIYNLAKKIYAVEPLEENVKNLLKTKNENHLDKIEVRQLAISDSNETKYMVESGKAGDGAWKISTDRDNSAKSTFLPVSCRTLGAFMEEEKIDFADVVKIDVEGHELAIINAPDFPVQKIAAIVGEHHYWGNDDHQRDLKENLESRGFCYQEIPNHMFIAKR